MLKEHTNHTINKANHLASVPSNLLTSIITGVIGEMINFYSLPEIHPKQICYSTDSLTTQLAAKRLLRQIKKKKTNYFSPLFDPSESDLSMMDLDKPFDSNTEDAESLSYTVVDPPRLSEPWTADSNICALSEDIFPQM